MTFLVVGGLDAWNSVMADIKNTDDYLEIEATGVQFNWLLRYPGADNKLGARDYKLISAANPIGQVWSDSKNLDDFQPNEIVVPVGKKIRIRIVARDVLHSFYLPHFRVKMDAVPGMPTYFVFTPEVTTQQYRERIREYPEYQELTDPTDPESKPRWQTFDYELACAELCGSGHFSMRRIMKVVTQEEYDAWVKTQKPYYFESVRGKQDDPNIGKTLSGDLPTSPGDSSSLKGSEEINTGGKSVGGTINDTAAVQKKQLSK
jgi:cytochrome c oxidase subunit 2